MHRMQKRIDRSVWGCLFRKLGSKIPASCWRRNSWEGVTWQSSNSAPRFRLHEIFSGERGHLREIYRTGIRKVFACTQAATRTAARCSGMVWCSIFGHRADDFARVGSTSVRTSESGSTTAARRGTNKGTGGVRHRVEMHTQMPDCSGVGFKRTIFVLCLCS